MSNEECVYFFKRELDLIYDKEIRATVEAILRETPDYFLFIPASTTGKYHPDDEIIPGGKALHVKRVVFMANELCRMENYSPLEHDLLVGAAIIHDMFFKDTPEKEHSVSEHPQLIRKYTQGTLGSLPYYEELVGIAEKHSGQWGTESKYRPRQKLKLDKALHICDYVVSRRPVRVHVECARASDPEGSAK